MGSTDERLHLGLGVFRFRVWGILGLGFGGLKFRVWGF